jgi:hypothetical protein
MFEGDLTALSTPELLESAAEHRAEENRRAARLIEHAQVFADRYHPDVCPRRPGRRGWEGRERGVVLGGDGCPEIPEFAAAEFGLMIGISAGAAANYIGQALALRHRLPFTWARVRAGEATPWKARKIATACLELSQDAARAVDQRVAKIVDTLTPDRLDKIVEAAKKHADPEGARKKAEEKARERGVYVGRSDDHGTQTIYVRAASGQVRRFNATIASIAEALKVFGDTRSLQTRRADAVGIIADPRYTEELLLQARQQLLNNPNNTTACPPEPPSTADHSTAPHSTAPATDQDADQGAAPADNRATDRDVASTADPAASRSATPTDREPVEPWDSGLRIEPEVGEPLDAAARRTLHARLAQIKHNAHTKPTTHGASGGRLRPGKTEIYVHLTDHTLATGTGVLRAEGIGPLLASQLAELVGHGAYVVKPVIDLNDAVSVDAYEIPDRIRERVRLIHPVEVFPYGTRETHPTMDLDHIQPYDPLGAPGQTSTSNLAPLGRFSHRVKTHGRGWRLRRLDQKTIEWNTPNGFTFHVEPTGTHRVQGPQSDE